MATASAGASEPVSAATLIRDPLTASEPVSAATLILHPLMARAVFRGARWASNAPVRHLNRFRAVFNRGRVERDSLSDTDRWSLILAAVDSWFGQQDLGLFVLQRGLLDLKRRRIYSVDIVCELGGQCCLVCLFHGGREKFAKHEVEYARRLRRVAMGTYGAAVRVICLKVWGQGCQVSEWEVEAEE